MIHDQDAGAGMEQSGGGAEFPQGRAALWEFSTATALLHAGAGILIMYHPEAAMALRRTITNLMDGRN